MSGKPLTEVSGEEIALLTVPLILSLVIGMVAFAITGAAEPSVTVSTLMGVLVFALFWPRIVDLGFGLEQPKF